MSEGTFCPPSGPGAPRSSHTHTQTHVSFLMGTALFGAAKILQRLEKYVIYVRGIKSKNKTHRNLQEAPTPWETFIENNAAFMGRAAFLIVFFGLFGMFAHSTEIGKCL